MEYHFEGRDMSFAEKLKEIRGGTGMSQQSLAVAAGLSIAVVRDYEQGKKEPTFRSAAKLATALRVSLDVFAASLADDSTVHSQTPPRGRPRKTTPVEAVPIEEATDVPSPAKKTKKRKGK
jgi:transcriptional regulator with XRE-family HTH domain